MATIADCKVDPEFRDLIPLADADERHDLAENVRQFGFLSPIVVWRNERDELVVLDGHARLQLHRDAVGRPEGAGLAIHPPAVVELSLPDRDSAMLFVINAQLGRRNVSGIDKIALVAEKERIIRERAKRNQRAAGGDRKSIFGSLSALLPKAISPVDVRKECAAEAGVSEKVYDDGKAIISAVDHGELPPTIIDEIRVGKKSISGVARGLKGKPARKAKSSGWQSAVKAFSTLIHRVIKRDPNRSAEIAAELRRIADEIENVVAAAA